MFGCTVLSKIRNPIMNCTLEAILKRQVMIRNKYIEDTYFFEVNTKYISSNVLIISVISRVRSTSEIAGIFKHMR